MQLGPKAKRPTRRSIWTEPGLIVTAGFAVSQPAFPQGRYQETFPPMKTTGSRIGNYSSSDASNYEESEHPRQPVGIQDILAFLTDQGRSPLEAQVVADLPCGSGLYVPFLTAQKLILTDYSQGMLDEAQKSVPDPAPKELVAFQGDLTSTLPIESGSVDSILCNQFIHHVSTPEVEEDRWTGLRRVLASFYRILKPGGKVAISFCTRTQVANSYWTHSIFSDDAIAEEITYYPTREELSELLSEAGFAASNIAFDVIRQDLQKDVWTIDPMDPKLQSGDSGFRFALKTSERRAEMERKWLALQKDPDALTAVKAAARDFVADKGSSTLCLATKT